MNPLNLKSKLLRHSLILAAPLMLASCQEKDADPAESSPSEAAATAKPTRAAAVSLLKTFAAEMEAGKVELAIQKMKIPPGMPAEEMVKVLAPIVEKKEISSAGVALLEKEGTWGKLTEVFPTRGSALAERWQLEPDNCWGLGLEPAMIAFYWTGDSFLIFRCDDVGKLGPEA